MVVTAVAPKAMPMVGFLTEPNQASVTKKKFWGAKFSFDIISLDGIGGQWFCVFNWLRHCLIVVPWMV